MLWIANQGYGGGAGHVYDGPGGAPDYVGHPGVVIFDLVPYEWSREDNFVTSLDKNHWSKRDMIQIAHCAELLLSNVTELIELFNYVQGSTNRRAPGCMNAAGKLRQKW